MMDELERVRMFRGDVPEPRPDQVVEARAGFMNAVALEEAGPARKARPRAAWLVAAAAAIVLVMVVPAALPGGSPGGAGVAAAGVGFTQDGNYLIATIDDPTASAAEMQAAFAQHGFDIQVQLQPSSPSGVGMIPFEDGAATGTPQIQNITTPCAADPVYGCTTGIRIPMGFSDHAAIVVTHAAAPGEQYVWPGDAYAPGEALHCSGLRGMTAADASPILQGLGLTGRWQIFGHAGGDGVSQGSVADYVIGQAATLSSDTVEFIVSPKPLTPADINLPPDLYYRTYDRQIKNEDQGC
jgi:hypothetical protein